MKERNEHFPSALEAIFVVIGLFGAEHLVAAALYDARGVLGVHPRDLEGAVVILGNAIIFIALMHYKQLSYGPLFHSSRSSASATLITLTLPILLVVPGLLAFMSAVNNLLVWLFPMSRWEEAMFERMMSNGIASVIATCLLAPVLEEMLFRGIILRSFLHQYSRWIAIVGSAALFGAAHLNIYQFAVGLGAGLLLGWLYERTQSLWPCILLHGAYNSGVTVIYFLLDKPAASEPWSMAPQSGILAIVAAAVGLVLLHRVLVPRDSS